MVYLMRSPDLNGFVSPVDRSTNPAWAADDRVVDEVKLGLVDH
jgi:hypothetical protein